MLWVEGPVSQKLDLSSEVFTQLYSSVTLFDAIHNSGVAGENKVGIQKIKMSMTNILRGNFIRNI